MLIPNEWNVPEVFRQRLGERVGRQRAMTADGHLLLVLHKLPKPGDPTREGVLVWRDPDGRWAGTSRGEPPASLHRHVEEFGAAVDALEERCDRAASAADYFDVINGITPLHRSASHLHATLQTAREAVPEERALILARDRAGEIEREAELLHHEAVNGLQFRNAQRAEELARSSHELAEAGHRINLLVAFFFPLTALTSLFGMNLRSGLEEHFTPLLFWTVLAASFAVGLLLYAQLQRRNGTADERR